MSKHLEQQFKDIAKTLSSHGYTKLKMHDLIKDALPTIEYFENRQRVSIRNIKIVIEFLSGLKRADIIINHDIKKSTFRACYDSGVVAIREQLNIRNEEKENEDEDVNNLKWIHPCRVPEQTAASKEKWIEHAKEALKQFEDGKAYYLLSNKILKIR